MFRLKQFFGLWLVLAAALALPSAHALESHGEPVDLQLTDHVPGAAALEGKIIAPCCWNQTIDIHGSPASSALRNEIRTRLKAGESAEVIEQSIVERYGSKILAVPQGSRLGKAGLLLAIGMGAAGIGAVAMLRRWQRRSSQPKSLDPADANQPPPSDALDRRLDAELSRLD